MPTREQRVFSLSLSPPPSLFPASVRDARKARKARLCACVHSTYPTYPTYCDTNERTRDTRPCNHLVERPVETQRDVLFAQSSGIAILQLAQSDVRPSAPHRGRTTGESRMAPFRLSPSSPLPSPLPIFSLFSLSLSLSLSLPPFLVFLVFPSSNRRIGDDTAAIAAG